MPSISNFSDFDPLENDASIQIQWIKEAQDLKIRSIIIPGSKQTLKTNLFLENTGLQENIKDYSYQGGKHFGNLWRLTNSR